MGHPRAALLAVCVAVLAYNVLAALQTAAKARHDLQASDIELSSCYVATKVKANYAGMLMAVATTAWQMYDAMTFQELAHTLRRSIHHVKASTRPQKMKSKGYV